MTQPYLHPVANDNARFEAGAETVDNVGNGAPPSPPETERAKRASKARADKALPTDRLKFDNQVKILRAVAITSGNSRRGSNAEAMSAAIDLSGTTGGLNSRFFRSAGWFESVGRGEYTASAGVLAYNQHINIDPDAQYEATAKMREEVRQSWFWEVLEPMLSSGHPISQKLAILELAKAAGASNHTYQIETILDWLEWVGLAVREGDQVKLRQVQDTVADAGGESTTLENEVIEPIETETGAATAIDIPDEQSTSPAAPAAQDGDIGAIVSFNMSVRLTAADMKSLDQDQREFVLALAERLRG